MSAVAKHASNVVVIGSVAQVHADSRKAVVGWLQTPKALAP
jgi:hypothetical protein